MLITSELANQNARKTLFTRVVYINMCYYYACSRGSQIQFTYTGKHFDICLMSKVCPPTTLYLVTFFPKTMWSHPVTKTLQSSCPTTRNLKSFEKTIYSKELKVSVAVPSFYAEILICQLCPSLLTLSWQTSNSTQIWPKSAFFNHRTYKLTESPTAVIQAERNKLTLIRYLS